MSPVFDCTTPQGRADAIPKAAAGVRDGSLVVLPTDTIYGIGADAFLPDAVAALLAAKGRGRDMPPPVLVGDATVLDALAEDVPAWARALVAEFWPGPLTIVVEARTSLAWDLGDAAGTVAVRMPDNDVALELLRAVGPMAVSSANRSGHPASRTVVEAATQLGAAVTFYLDGGAVGGGLASTIVDCTGEEPVVLREGALPSEEIHAVVARARAADPADVADASADVADASGEVADASGEADTGPARAVAPVEAVEFDAAGLPPFEGPPPQAPSFEGPSPEAPAIEGPPPRAAVPDRPSRDPSDTASRGPVVDLLDPVPPHPARAKEPDRS